MAIEVYDAVKETRKIVMLWLAAAALCAGIAAAVSCAVRLIAGFADGFRALVRQMFF